MDQEQGYFHTSTIPAQAFEEAWTVAEVDEANRKRAILNAVNPRAAGSLLTILAQSG